MHAGSGEFAPDPNSAFAIRKITAAASRKIAERAFALARHRRGKVTAVNKSNVLKISDGLFLRECRAAAQENPDIVYEEELVDAVASKLVRDRGGYDVLVTTNLFGDILSNEAAELSGGLGLSGSLNHGDNHAMAQASHGSAPDIAGKGIANPSSMILSTALLLDHLGQKHDRPDLVDAARRIEGALKSSLLSASARTADLGGSAGTEAALNSVIAHLRTARGSGL
jgi:3-isopropylmalate dehydrogenase